MTEQQQPNPIDDLFRNTFEQLPDSPSASGWDKPSDRVWQNIQNNMQAAPKQGWQLSSIVLLTTMAILVVAGIYWLTTRTEPTQPQNVLPTATEQPVTAPVNATNAPGEAADTAPKVSTPDTKAKTTPAKPASKSDNNTAPASKSSDNAAQPLPGSKTTLPPNTTEANKHKQQ